MRQSDRQTLRAQYSFRCGYCGIREIDVGSELTVDHFHPRAHNGNDNLENLVYCCYACNTFKGDYWQPASVQRLLHPLRDNLSDHFIETSDGTLRALSATGVFHIDHLHLNRPGLVSHRREQRLQEAARAEQQILIQRLNHLEQRVEILQEQIRQVAPLTDEAT